MDKAAFSPEERERMVEGPEASGKGAEGAAEASGTAAPAGDASAEGVAPSSDSKN